MDLQDSCLKVACVSHPEGNALYSMVDLAVWVKRKRDLKKGERGKEEGEEKGEGRKGEKGRGRKGRGN